METFIFEKYVRYTFTIYPVAIIASVGVFVGAEESSKLTDNDVINGELPIMYYRLSFINFPHAHVRC